LQNNRQCYVFSKGQSTGSKSPPSSQILSSGLPKIFSYPTFSRLFSSAPRANLFGYQRIKVLVSGCRSSNIAGEPFREILLLLNLDRSAVKDVSNSYITPGHKSDKLELKRPWRRQLFSFSWMKLLSAQAVASRQSRMQLIHLISFWENAVFFLLVQPPGFGIS